LLQPTFNFTDRFLYSFPVSNLSVTGAKDFTEERQRVSYRKKELYENYFEKIG
jgi:hypothetical protein